MAISDTITSMYENVGNVYDVLELAGADLTNVDKNIQNLKQSWEERLLYFLANGTDTLWNNWLPKVSGSGETITLNNTIEAKMDFVYKGNTSQTGTPTPDTPIPVQVVSGDNSIDVCGKNLFNVENGTRTYGGQTYSIEDNIFKFSSTTVSGGVSAGVITPYTSYSFDTSSSYVWSLNKKSGNWTKGSAYPRVLIYIKYSDNTTSYSQINLNTDNQESASNTITFTSGKIPVSFAFGIYAPNGSLSNNVSAEYYVQLEKGSTATTYEEYKGVSYPINLGNIELCKIGDYQDKIYKDNGKWYLNKQIGKVVLNGSETITRQINTDNETYRWHIRVEDIKYYGSSELPNVFSTHFTEITRSQIYNYTNGITSNQNLLMIYDDLFKTMTLNEFKVWLSANTPKVLYQINTPTYEPITDTTLISQLEAIKKSYNTQTNISQENNDLPFELDVVALGKLS